jgi:hypothetical protein
LHLIYLVKTNGVNLPRVFRKKKVVGITLGITSMNDRDSLAVPYGSREQSKFVQELEKT